MEQTKQEQLFSAFLEGTKTLLPKYTSQVQIQRTAYTKAILDCQDLFKEVYLKYYGQ